MLTSLRQGLLGGELEGHHPARRLGRGAQAVLLAVIVDLDDHAVGVVRQVVAFVVPAVAIVDDLVDGVELSDVAD